MYFHKMILTLGKSLGNLNKIYAGDFIVQSLNCVLLFTTPWTAAYQAPPSMGFTRQEYWSGVPLPSPLTHIVTWYRILCWK